MLERTTKEALIDPSGPAASSYTRIFGDWETAQKRLLAGTEEFLSELDERSRLLFAPVTQASLQGAGLLLGDDGVAVIRKNDHEEPVETRLFQAPLG